MEKKKVKEERKINLLKIFYLNGGEKFSLIFRWWTLPILFYLPRHFSKEKFYSEFHLSEFHSYRYFFHLSKENSNVHTNVYTTRRSRDQRHHFEQLSPHLYLLQYRKKLLKIIPSTTQAWRASKRKKKKFSFLSFLCFRRIGWSAGALNAKHNWIKRRIHRLTY